MNDGARDNGEVALDALKLSGVAELLADQAVEEFDALAGDASEDTAALDGWFERALRLERSRRRKEVLWKAADAALAVLLTGALLLSMAFVAVGLLLYEAIRPALLAVARRHLPEPGPVAKQCVPSRLPPGFQPFARSASGPLCYISFARGGGAELLVLLESDEPEFYRARPAPSHPVRVGDAPGELSADGSFLTLTWRRGGRFFALSGPVSEEELLRTAESVG